MIFLFLNIVKDLIVLKMKTTAKQFKFGLLILALIVIVGIIGYRIIEPSFSFLDSIYMTIITISTTGFGEVHRLSEAGRIFTILLIISGVLTIAYTGGKAAQLIVENNLFGRRRMNKKIKLLENHYIVCGYGRMGKVICDGLKNHGIPFVVIESEPNIIEKLEESNILHIEGDATTDESLLLAGVKKARGLVAAIKSDADNVFTVLSAKELNPELFVVARAIDEGTENKLKKAGADRVVKPYELGGNRMLYLLLKPGVIEFIDGIARSENMKISLEEITISPKSMLAGLELRESPVREELNIIVVSLHRKDGGFIYNPRGTTRLMAGDKLIAIGDKANLIKLEKYCLGEV